MKKISDVILAEVYMLSQTSKIAYNKILPELGERQLVVYKTIEKLEYCTNSMVSKFLKLPINQITPRTHELRRKHIKGEFLVIRSHISRCPITKHAAQYWKINNNLNKQEEKI